MTIHSSLIRLKHPPFIEVNFTKNFSVGKIYLVIIDLSLFNNLKKISVSPCNNRGKFSLSFKFINLNLQSISNIENNLIVDGNYIKIIKVYSKKRPKLIKKQNL